jgi:hypothetical protein
MTRRAWVLGLAAALLVAGCGGDDAEAPSQSPSGATSTPPSQSASPSPTTLPGFGPGPSSTTATGNGVALLTAVRVAGQDGFDRVVWEFEGPVPACTVRSVPPPIKADPSDQVVAVAGTAFVQLTCQSASGVDLSADPYRETYTGADRVSAGDTEVVTEAVLTGDFEAVLTWTVGLQQASPFRVSTLTGPSRVILDVQG